MSRLRHWSFFALGRLFRLPEWLEWLLALAGISWTCCAVFSQDSPWRRVVLSMILWPWAPFWIWIGVALAVAHLIGLQRKAWAFRLGAVVASTVFWNHCAWGIVGALIIHHIGDIPMLLSPAIFVAVLTAGLTYRMAAGLGADTT